MSENLKFIRTYSEAIESFNLYLNSAKELTVDINRKFELLDLRDKVNCKKIDNIDKEIEILKIKINTLNTKIEMLQ